MKIDFSQFYLFSVPVNFNLSWLKILSSNHLVVRLKSRNSRGREKEGWGEGVLYQTPCLRCLELLSRELEEFFDQEFTNCRQAREKLSQKFSRFPGLICAFDLALWDLEAKLKGEPVWRLWGKRKREEVLAAEQIFIPRSREDLINQTEEILARGTKIIKLKAGRNPETDLENIKQIRRIAGKKIKIQLDFNQSLSFNQAIWFARQLDSELITAWEEPIKFEQFDQLNKLRRKTKIPIILDESIKKEEKLIEAIKEKAIDILNIKIARLGGITASLQFIKLAQKAGLEIEIGCNEELGIATQAQLHLAYFLRKLRVMEALGSQRLGFDIIKEKVEIDKGYFRKLLRRPGWGVKFIPQKLWGTAGRLRFPVLTKDSPEFPFGFYLHCFRNRLENKFQNGILFLKRKIYQERKKSTTPGAEGAGGAGGK